MKKIIPLMLAMLLLCGCSSILEGNLDYSTPHSSAPETPSDPIYIEVSNYTQLKQAMLSFVNDHLDDGVIRFLSNYAGNIEEDLNNACIYVTNDTAIGSYSVSYIGSSLSKIVSYYEATISIIYKLDKEQITGIEDISSVSQLDPVFQKMMEQCMESDAIRTSNQAITSDSLTRAMNNLYYSDPKLIIALPKMTVEEFSDTNGSNHIFEINMEYPYSASEMQGRKNAFDSILQQISFQLTETDNKSLLLYQLCNYLADTVNYSELVADEKYDQFDPVNTAYGALFDRKASGEGFAMAMQLLCNWQGIDCKVVVGRYNNFVHAWNMIKVENNWYHFDVSNMKNNTGKSLMRTDSQMEGSYSWDTAKYPVCNGELNYTYLINQIQPVDTPEDNTPEDNDDDVPVTPDEPEEEE